MRRLVSPFRSIKVQILFAFALLVIPVVALLLAYLQLQSNFPQALQAQQRSEAITALALRVERDVIDLQRNVLIFKQTKTVVASEKVKYFFTSIEQRLDQLYKLLEKSEETIQIDRMREHLNDYGNNFKTVVVMREKRNDQLDVHVKHENKIHQLIMSTKYLTTDVSQYINTAQKKSLQYLLDGRGDHVSLFQSALASARLSVTSVSDVTDENLLLLDALSEYEKNFMRIKQFTRSYVYLINVVMAGSAHEMLFLASSLDDRLRGDQEAEYEKVLIKSKQQLKASLLFTVFFSAIIGLVITYLFKKITTPIIDMTGVFTRLADGEAIAEIPGLEREDEIGRMAEAANVFRATNAKTVSLLADTQDLLAQQDVLNQSLEVEKKRAEQALSARTQFMANMSHELRTPLNSVIGYTARLLKHSDQYSERHNDAIKTISRNGKHLLSMINDILDISKMEAEKLDMNPEHCDLIELSNHCIAQLQQLADDKELLIMTDFPEVPLSIFTDATRFSQIVINLLSNAIKYTNTGWVKVHIKTHEDPNWVLVEVSDSGIGISVDDMNSLFKRFEQFDTASKDKIGYGTGLGLAIVANVTQLLGGGVSAQSTFGIGSCFRLLLPKAFFEEIEN